jgi:hypothetical protein
MSRWYGQGGYWINHGLPQYIAIDRKPKFGCEVQNSCCSRSGIMMQLKLVKTMEEPYTHAQPGDNGLLHGTAVLKYLVLPWARIDRIMCPDSYFASEENDMNWIEIHCICQDHNLAVSTVIYFKP